MTPSSMGSIFRLALALGLFVWPAPAGARQGEPLCGDCQSTGRVPRELDAEAVALEQGALLCSIALDQDPEGLGLDWKPCPKCVRPSAKQKAVEEFEAALLPKRAWLKARREAVDAVVKSPVDHLETEHFVLAWDLPRIKIDRKIVDRHRALHLYARRLEDLRTRIFEQIGLTDADTNGVKHHVYMFERHKTAIAMAPVVTGRSLVKDTKISLLGIESHMVSWDNPQVITNDEERHQFLVHAVSHHIHDGLEDRRHWLFQRYGWVYEGLAHFQEIRDFGPPIAWCSAEGGAFSNWQSATWEANVKKAVKAKEQPVFQEVIRKSAGSLSPMEHQFAWSYIDYLMWLDPHAMKRALELMIGPQKDVRDVLKEAYGLSVGQFVDGWTAFVLEEYKTRSRKGPYQRPPRS